MVALSKVCGGSVRQNRLKRTSDFATSSNDKTLTLDRSIEPGTIKGFIDNLTVQSIH